MEWFESTKHQIRLWVAEKFPNLHEQVFLLESVFIQNFEKKINLKIFWDKKNHQIF